MNWPINVIITCETGKLLGEVAQMYLFLDFMTDDKLFTHQLPRAMHIYISVKSKGKMNLIEANWEFTRITATAQAVEICRMVKNEKERATK